MMDHDVENTIINAIQPGLSGLATPLVAVNSMRDLGTDELVLPLVIVKATEKTLVAANKPNYEFDVEIEYKSNPAQSVGADIRAAMNSIENSLLHPVIPTTTPFQFFAYHGLEQVSHTVNQDRRTNLRQLKVTVQ